MQLEFSQRSRGACSIVLVPPERCYLLTAYIVGFVNYSASYPITARDLPSILLLLDVRGNRYQATYRYDLNHLYGSISKPPYINIGMSHVPYQHSRSPSNPNHGTCLLDLSPARLLHIHQRG